MTAKCFPNEYKLASLSDLHGEDGAPASFHWFCSYQSSDNVYVALAFGLLLGILRLKSLSNCQFVMSKYFKSVVSSINFRGFDCTDSVEDVSGKLSYLQRQEGTSEAQLISSAVPTPPSMPVQLNRKSCQILKACACQTILPAIQSTLERRRGPFSS